MVETIQERDEGGRTFYENRPQLGAHERMWFLELFSHGFHRKEPPALPVGKNTGIWTCSCRNWG